MAIITISQGSYTHGARVAERVATTLGYDSISREVLLEASALFKVPEARLVRAMENSPSLFERITQGRQRYVAFIRAAVLAHLKADRVVYHGFAGQFFVRELPNVLKVRIVAESEQRIALVAQRDGVSPKEAALIIARDDTERRRWSQHLYGIDVADPNLYDLVVRIDRLTVDNAAELICNAARRPAFATTPDAIRRLEDLALGAAVHAALLDVTADVEVSASQGLVTIATVPRLAELTSASEHLRQLAMTVPGVQGVLITAAAGAGARLAESSLC